MRNVVVVGAVRTAVGRMGGALIDVPAEHLAAVVLRAAIKRAGIEASAVDQVILGQAKQSPDASNIARVAALEAEYPIDVPAYTVNQQCGSGMMALHNAFQAIALGLADIVVAGGVESMSTAPYYLRKARFGYVAGNAELLDPNTESQPGSQPIAQYGRLTMGETAETLAERYRISRQEQDEFALESQEKAWAALEGGRFAAEIEPVLVPQRRGDPVPFDKDEHPRKTSLEQLARLQPVFKKDGTVTAGNASGRNDGASALVVMAEETARERGLRPLARIIGLGVSGVGPDVMGLGPVEASRRALAHASTIADTPLSPEDIDLFEINEAFAAQVLAVLREFPVPRERLNVNGGAIALGHPIGNSGARICVTLLHEMEKRGAEHGLASLCVAGGQGIATVFRRVD